MRNKSYIDTTAYINSCGGLEFKFKENRWISLSKFNPNPLLHTFKHASSSISNRRRCNRRRIFVRDPFPLRVRFCDPLLFGSYSL